MKTKLHIVITFVFTIGAMAQTITTNSITPTNSVVQIFLPEDTGFKRMNWVGTNSACYDWQRAIPAQPKERWDVVTTGDLISTTVVIGSETRNIDVFKPESVTVKHFVWNVDDRTFVKTEDIPPFPDLRQWVTRTNRL